MSEWTTRLPPELTRAYGRIKFDADAPDGILVHSFSGDDPTRCKDYVRQKAGLATTVAGGAKWNEESIAPLAGRDISILSDVDDVGHKRAMEAAEALYSRAKSVRVVHLPGLTGEPANKDVSDWLDASPYRGADELTNVCFDPPVPLYGVARRAGRPRDETASPRWSGMPFSSSSASVGLFSWSIA
jgi:hypothetical protein